MKTKLTRALCLMTLASAFIVLPFAAFAARSNSSTALTQSAEAAAQNANQSTTEAHNEHTDAANAPDEKDEYRLAHLTVMTARLLHISPRAAALLLEVLNFGILGVAIFSFTRKRLPGFFRTRTETLQRNLVEARIATEDANHRLHAIEERLAHLDNEIIGMRQQAERDTLRQEESFRDVLAQEKDRIVTQAEQEIASAGQAARRELKLYAADLAVASAEKRLQMTPEMDQKMIDEFLQGLGAKQ